MHGYTDEFSKHVGPDVDEPCR